MWENILGSLKYDIVAHTVASITILGFSFPNYLLNVSKIRVYLSCWFTKFCVDLPFSNQRLFNKQSHLKLTAWHSDIYNLKRSKDYPCKIWFVQIENSDLA